MNKFFPTLALTLVLSALAMPPTENVNRQPQTPERPANLKTLVQRLGQTDTAPVCGFGVEFDAPLTADVVQIRRLLAGQKDLKWTLPVNKLEKVGSNRLRWIDAAPVVNVATSYKVRFKLNTLTGPWSQEVEVCAAETGGPLNPFAQPAQPAQPGHPAEPPQPSQPPLPGH